MARTQCDGQWEIEFVYRRYFVRVCGRRSSDIYHVENVPEACFACNVVSEGSVEVLPPSVMCAMSAGSSSLAIDRDEYEFVDGDWDDEHVGLYHPFGVGHGPSVLRDARMSNKLPGKKVRSQ